MMEILKRASYTVLLVCFVASSLSHFSDAAVEVMSQESSAGGRGLLQNNILPCPKDYNFYNFTPIISACPNSTNISVVGTFDTKKCCQSLCIVLGAKGDYINDERYDCAAQFFSYLTLAGHYSQGYFAFICTDPSSEKGIYCAPVETPPAADSNSGRASGGANSIFLFVLLAIAVFESLILAA